MDYFDVTTIEELDTATLTLGEDRRIWCVCSINKYTYKFDFLSILNQLSSSNSSIGDTLKTLTTQVEKLISSAEAGGSVHYHKINTIDLQGVILDGGTCGSRAEAQGVIERPADTPVILPEGVKGETT